MKVKITDPKHPHHGETGEFTGKVIELRGSRKQMAEVKLDNCQHGEDSCFVSKGQVKEIKP